MPDEIKLSTSNYDTLSLAATAKSNSFIEENTGVNVYSSAETAGAVASTIVGGAEAIALAPGIAAEVIAEVVTNVSVYGAQVLGESLAKVVMPPNPADIVGGASKEVSKFIADTGEIMKDLTEDAENRSKKQEEDARAQDLQELTNKHKENVEKVKGKVNKIIADVKVKCEQINKYVLQGPDWVEQQANEIQNKACETIDKYVKEQAAKIQKSKDDYVKEQSNALAQNLAKKLNDEKKQKLADKLNKANQSKTKTVNKAKASVGKALLKMMVKIGL